MHANAFFCQVDELDEGASEIVQVQVPARSVHAVPPRSNAIPARGGGSAPRRGFGLRPVGFTSLHPRSAEQPSSVGQDGCAGGTGYHPMQQSRQLSNYPAGAQTGRAGQWNDRDRGGGRQEGNAWNDEGWRQDTSKNGFQNSDARLQGLHSANSQERTMPWTLSGSGGRPGGRCGDETNDYHEKAHERPSRSVHSPPSNVLQPAQKANARSNAEIMGV